MTLQLRLSLWRDTWQSESVDRNFGKSPETSYGGGKVIGWLSDNEFLYTNRRERANFRQRAAKGSNRSHDQAPPTSFLLVMYMEYHGTIAENWFLQLIGRILIVPRCCIHSLLYASWTNEPFSYIIVDAMPAWRVQMREFPYLFNQHEKYNVTSRRSFSVHIYADPCDLEAAHAQNWLCMWKFPVDDIMCFSYMDSTRFLVNVSK